MVSTFTPAALAKTPMVRWSSVFFITLDSVAGYGTKIMSFTHRSKGGFHVGTAKWSCCTCHGRACCSRRLGLLPGTFDSSNPGHQRRSEEHTSELQSLMRISYAVFCLKKKIQQQKNNKTHIN